MKKPYVRNKFLVSYIFYDNYLNFGWHFDTEILNNLLSLRNLNLVSTFQNNSNLLAAKTQWSIMPFPFPF